ncbi:hypothetical protein AKJ66_03835 [candidate division MSBL1 archaeon SCGC-AAA259E22]|uniref:Uncharacterized protein n=1 Tax=candidate division MSBL1 archaeon SCGC-AAA259E22 TaxID=1698265 RepID=A0A133UEL7_9EURY|nr:hypothetical protein AKJ66_03835 [candidate division MSBL1 archaeon SCGC-AAA259E22]
MCFSRSSGGWLSFFSTVFFVSLAVYISEKQGEYVQREYKEAVAIGIGGGMGGSVLIYAITGEFPWN